MEVAEFARTGGPVTPEIQGLRQAAVWVGGDVAGAEAGLVQGARGHGRRRRKKAMERGEGGKVKEVGIWALRWRVCRERV